MEKEVDAFDFRVVGVWPDANWNSRHDEVMAVIVVVVVPVFVTEMLLEGEIKPTYVFANVRELGVEVTCAEAATRKSALRRKPLAKQKSIRRATVGMVLSSEGSVCRWSDFARLGTVNSQDHKTARELKPIGGDGQPGDHLNKRRGPSCILRWRRMSVKDECSCTPRLHASQCLGLRGL